ncbi:MAG: hypothetical protein R3277_11720 [Brumimicrobium sp.]|nr:hypothetical protein [Brumimicrobium sp.]
MIAKTSLLSFIFLLISLGFSHAQSTGPEPHDYHNALLQELKGVYQIQLDNPRLQPMISTELLEKVKENQKESVQNSFEYKSMKIVIKSKKEVSQGVLFDPSEFVVKRL